MKRRLRFERVKLEVYDNVKEFGEKRAVEHERKTKLQMEKKRQSQMLREQKMQNGNYNFKNKANV